MPHVIRRLALSRRALLRGGAVVVALPWLDAMRPAMAGPAKGPEKLRLAIVFGPNGQRMDTWTPKAEGALALSPTLEPFEAHKKQLLVLSGLTIHGGRALGDGPGDHAREGASFLTCAHPRKTGGADIKAGVSIDQLLASRVGAATAFPSLEVGTEAGTAGGVCDSGYACAYTNNISWRTESQPMPKEHRPRALFERLFGDPDAAEGSAARAKRLAERASVLDLVLEDAKRLVGRLGPADRRKLDEYLTSVREVEARLAKDAPATAVTVPEGLRGGPDVPAKIRLFFDLLVLAFQTDRTRFATFMLGNAGSNLSYGFLEAPEGHHDLSHHGGEAPKLEKVARINRFHAEQVAAFLDRLDAAKEDGSTLLERTIVLYASALADGNAHAHHDLPVLIAGGGGGWKTGRHVRFAKETPMANLYLSFLERFGQPDRAFADSTGTLL
jgi:hypothetical protein